MSLNKKQRLRTLIKERQRRLNREGEGRKQKLVKGILLDHQISSGIAANETLDIPKQLGERLGERLGNLFSVDALLNAGF